MKKLFLPAALAALIAGCAFPVASDGDARTFSHDEANSVYYWKTTLSLDSLDRKFLADNGVGRAYVRFFDVVVNNSSQGADAVIPNATLQVEDSLPVSEVVPTVFIDLEALRDAEGQEEALAERIVRRVANMCSYNGFAPLSELQLDCDWTAETEESFFALCSAVRDKLRELNPEAILSSTIRLHQLSQAAPPVDYGVLMVYNTGSFANPDAENSILSIDDVKPYMKHLDRYPLHLDVAYPAYSWNLLFRNGRFVRIFRQELPAEGSLLKKTGDGRYCVTTDTIIGGTWLFAGDIIRHEQPSAATVLEVKELVDSRLDPAGRSTVIYHLDSDNLSQFTADEIQKIYSK